MTEIATKEVIYWQIKKNKIDKPFCDMVQEMSDNGHRQYIQVSGDNETMIAGSNVDAWFVLAVQALGADRTNVMTGKPGGPVCPPGSQCPPTAE